MAREFDFLDPSTKRHCEEDYVSPPWFLDEVTSSSQVSGSSEASGADASADSVDIPSL